MESDEKGATRAQEFSGEASADAARISRTPLHVARTLLLVALGGGVWAVYRKLPPRAANETQIESRAKTNLRVVMRVARADRAALAGGVVELYSIDTSAAEREYLSERRAGVRFEDFLRERMKARPSIGGRFDDAGEAVIAAAPGRWWVHAHHAEGDAEWTWRVPVNLSGREQRIELTPENAYTRTQSY